MRSATLDQELARYEIGDRLRRLRLRKKLGLVELGRHTGLSAAMISKIERGRLFPTLPTLTRLAMVFGVGLEFFFEKRSPLVAVVRKGERLRLPEQPGRSPVAYHFECLDFAAVERKLDAYLATFEHIDAAEVVPHDHAGVEFIYVIRGMLVLSTMTGDIELEAGDAAYIDASHAHGYRAGRKGGAQGLVVTTR
jgi:transcriptional regulator with XRE-family HTH domain